MAKHKMKMGWFGWTFSIVIIVTLLGSSLFFLNVFNLDFNDIFNKDEQIETQKKKNDDEQASKETIEEVEKVQETVGQDHQDIGAFISDLHEFYNDTTGYGAINSLDWGDQVEQAELIVETIEAGLASIKNDALKTDLQHIQTFANQAMENQDTEDVRHLHRLFHDLDIALNNYNGYDKIWGVTETLKAVQ